MPQRQPPYSARDVFETITVERCLRRLCVCETSTRVLAWAVREARYQACCRKQTRDAVRLLALKHVAPELFLVCTLSAFRYIALDPNDLVFDLVEFDSSLVGGARAGLLHVAQPMVDLRWDIGGVERDALRRDRVGLEHEAVRLRRDTFGLDGFVVEHEVVGDRSRRGLEVGDVVDGGHGRGGNVLRERGLACLRVVFTTSSTRRLLQ